LKSVGISISRESLSAVVWEQNLLSSRAEHWCSVRCEEPFGGAADIARLASEIRNGTGGAALPPAVLSLPPSRTFVRRIELPVQDLPRAKKMHVAELEGNLPIEDEEILSDILPSPPGEGGKFLAIAARRSAVEKTVSGFSEAGFRLDRVITDHVALLLAVASEKAPFSGLVLSRLNDLIALRVEGGSLVWARQFPAEMIDARGEPSPEVREALAPGGGVDPSLPIRVFGEVPAFLSMLPTVSAHIPPAGLEEASPAAHGAALAPFFANRTGGFSLRTSVETELERTRGRNRVRIAAAAAAVALLSAAGSVSVAQWAERRKVDQVRARIRAEFTEAVPGTKVIVQETAQLRERIRSLNRQQKELGGDFPPATTMLARASGALPADGTISVREASFDAGRLRLAGDASSARLVESLRSSLVEAFGPGAAVTVQEAEGSAQGGTVKFTILIEDGGKGLAS
jgi:type II secretion system protein L